MKIQWVLLNFFVVYNEKLFVVRIPRKLPHWQFFWTKIVIYHSVHCFIQKYGNSWTVLTKWCHMERYKMSYLVFCFSDKSNKLYDNLPFWSTFDQSQLQTALMEHTVVVSSKRGQTTRFWKHKRGKMKMNRHATKFLRHKMDHD